MKKFFKFYLKHGGILVPVGMIIIMLSNFIGGIQLTIVGIIIFLSGIYPYIKK